MKKSIKIATTVMTLLISTLLFSQENAFRIGVKIGFPNVVGGNIEYVTPLLGKKLAPSIEYSTLPLNIDPDELKFTYFQVGLNYYFFKEGKGLYGNVNYGILDGELTLNEVESNFDDNKVGTAFVNVSNKSIGLKLGAKLGKVLYFRPEIGYAFTSLDEVLKVNVKFPDGSSENQNETMPDILTKGYLVNIGFGFAF
ncbi:MAG TPA: hypothetical protein VIN72_04035 [Lutibacter sp.]